MLFIKKLILGFTILISLSNPAADTMNGVNLPEDKTVKANYIAEICIENWNEYGCLPSVCIAQAILESDLGEKCYPYNYWGLHGGYYSYDSLEDGVYAYMEFINIHYDKAPFITSSSEQIQAIYNGGYCQGKSDYVSDINWIIKEYNLEYYDNLLFDEIERKEFQEAFVIKVSEYYKITLEMFEDYINFLKFIGIY